MRGTGQIQLVVQSRLENVALVAVAVRRLAEHLGLLFDDAASVELSVVEAVSNCMRHAYSGQVGHTVTVLVGAEDGTLSVKVCDSGRPMPEALRVPCCPEPDPARPEAISEGGRGVFLMHALMDEVEYRTMGPLNVVELRKRLPTPRAERQTV
jgi:serine/threonine-protein kinase RsbW